MSLTRLPVTQPVASVVFGLLLVALGIGAITRMPVREYPDVDPPIVSVGVVYPGASAEVVERDVVQPIEDNLSGIDGVELITSTSRAGFAQVDVEFLLRRDLDAAAGDVRDRVGAVRRALPEEVEEPVISKASADAQAMMWITLTSEQRDRRALTDFAIRELVDPLSLVPGVAQVIVGGERRYAMRLWLDPDRMSARGITVTEVANALRLENVELPGGRLERDTRELTVRVDSKLDAVDAFEALVVAQRDGYQITVADVARVELGAQSYRSAVFRNGRPAVGLGVVRQSGSNTVAVARETRATLDELRARVPSDIELSISYDRAIFIEGSLREVVRTLLITAALVIAVMVLFLGSLRATLVPAVTIPAALLAAMILPYALGFSINTLTLLALVLA
ncbi:MAG: efflux RND transporter permease subunit, partial [Gammaproteobacteria bacterium]|nr:efflux RND transporter permease subunit [Gammaproteobacteria bacterium]